jgi:hypothetical protein
VPGVHVFGWHVAESGSQKCVVRQDSTEVNEVPEGPHWYTTFASQKRWPASHCTAAQALFSQMPPASVQSVPGLVPSPSALQMTRLSPELSHVDEPGVQIHDIHEADEPSSLHVVPTKQDVVSKPLPIALHTSSAFAPSAHDVAPDKQLSTTQRPLAQW